ncbi:hypothetical protein RN001_010683 [Aquatica leii]|uniref:Ketosynthase family 3 (KS3) domain-containing protein n=1 Tax=Aquatica leii TaxID=1421715 RepID=A0AAN7SEL3_9COLE|nr:hypothetical protein RN001_010683 [Aquatica leii]
MQKKDSENKIMITGMAGIFPKTKNVAELYTNLLNKKQLFSPVDPYWKILTPSVPPVIGKQPFQTKFDAGYFDIHYKQAEEMHQNCRNLLELSVESIIDSGINPIDLKGTNTGVFVATSRIEAGAEWVYHKLSSPNFGIVGSTMSVLAERISYHLQLEGPTVTVNSACTSSLCALDCAVAAIKSGRCDSALVCGVNVIQNPNIHFGFHQLRALDPKGNGNVFDESCIGYIRSEATAAIFVQKMKAVKRIYAEILNVKTNCDGFKKAGMLHCSDEMITRLFQEVYEEVGVDPTTVFFVDCHVTGTVVGMVQELKAVENVFCSDRETPLLVGSVKANIGHSEGASGLTSLIKILIGLQQNCILPNPICQKVKPQPDALHNGKMSIATERVSLPTGQDVIIGCNNFGFGGTNAHLILKHHAQLNPTSQRIDSNRLVCFSARTMASFEEIISSFKDNPTEEYLALLQNIFKRNVDNYWYRGYVILNKKKILKQFGHYSNETLQLCLIYSHSTKKWLSKFGKFKNITGLSQTINRMSKILSAKDVDLLRLWKSKKQKLGFEDCVLRTITLQIILTDLLKNLLQQQIILVQGFFSGAIANVLYSNVTWPVKAPLISPLIQWHHIDDWHVLKYQLKNLSIHVITINLEHKDWKFLTGYIVDGQNLFPVTAYLVMVWNCYLKANRLFMNQTKILFEDVKFHRSIVVSKKKPLNLTVNLTKIQNKFEISDGNDCLLETKIRRWKTNSEFMTSFKFTSTSQQTMNTTDIYKKLSLHGYNYRNQFCCLKEVSLDGKVGIINWNNWITFLDGIQQFTIVNKELDVLYLPLKIGQLSIDPEKHAQALNEHNYAVPISYELDCDTVSTPGIEFRNLILANSKKHSTEEPVLEVYKFVPFDADLSLENSIKVHIELVLENIFNSLKIIEIVDSFSSNTKLLCPIIEHVLKNGFPIKRNLTVYSTKIIDSSNVTFEHKTIKQLPSDINLLVMSGGSKRLIEIAQILQNHNCFILSREDFYFETFKHVEVISTHRTNLESFVLLRRSSEIPKKIIEITSDFFWLEQLKLTLSKNEKVLLVAQNDPTSGMLGLVRCLKEEVGQSVTSVFLTDAAKKFNVDDDFYNNQLKKSLLINVFKHGQWGSYRHLPLHQEQRNCKHAFGVTTSGNLSSLQFIEGPFMKVPDKNLIHVNVLSSITNCNKTMGIVSNGAFSNFVPIDKSITCPIPHTWSMEDAATVPLVYFTVLHALLKVARLKRGQSVLIHSGTGGVGQAAINISLHFNCKIFTTVGSTEKQNYLKTLYPSILDSHIGNSHDIKFEQMILKQTKGKGVDIILNSLADNKLQASTRCLARRGIFIELGKQNVSILLDSFSNGRTYAGIFVDKFYDKNAKKKQLQLLMQQGIETGYVKPLPRVVYGKTKLQDAVRYMSIGKHTGKIVIKFQDELTKNILPVKATRRFFCDINKVYVIIGGLGGFGIELVDWLIGRNAKKIILVSRNGITTGYQNYKINYWENLGCKVLVNQNNLTIEEECMKLLTIANTLGNIDGIFNLSVVLHDATIENQNKDTFKYVFEPKVVITRNLDTMSRRLCPYLRYFVVFSSIVCGRGNSGQTNYGMANSIAERICEQRKREGYPALAIQWGLIGDVGFVAEKLSTVVPMYGLEKQQISSCLNVMDIFLNQKEPIVSSSVFGHQQTKRKSKSEDLLTTVAEILAITNLKHVSMYTKLSSLGMDSISNTQLKQYLSAECSMHFSVNELRNMTLQMLVEKNNTFKH